MIWFSSRPLKDMSPQKVRIPPLNLSCLASTVERKAVRAVEYQILHGYMATSSMVGSGGKLSSVRWCYQEANIGRPFLGDKERGDLQHFWHPLWRMNMSEQCTMFYRRQPLDKDGKPACLTSYASWQAQIKEASTGLTVRPEAIFYWLLFRLFRSVEVGPIPAHEPG